MFTRKMFSLIVMASMILAVLPVPTVAAQTGPGLTTSASGRQPSAQPPAALDSSLVLWDQYTIGTRFFAAQDFETANDAYDIYAGDDFTNADPWNLQTITTAGTWNTYPDLHNASAIHWYIYADDGGKPAGVPGDGNEFWSISLPPSDPQVGLDVNMTDDVVLTLDTPVELPAGTWWLVHYVSLDFGSYGQWGWYGNASPAWGAYGSQNNPGGGFGMAAGWNPNTYSMDFAFRLEGEIGQTVDCEWVPVLQQDFEGTFPPAGWTVNDTGSCTPGWRRNDGWGSLRTNYTGGGGYCADADIDKCGSGKTINTRLTTPAYNLATALKARATFNAAYNDLGSNDYFAVDASTNGGGSWTNLLTWNQDHSAYGPGEVVSLDLAAYTGSSNVSLSFHYWTTSWDYYAEVDKVLVEACVPPRLAVTPAQQNGVGCQDGEALHNFVVLNNSGAPQSYTAAVTGNTWPSSLSETSFSLADGEKKTLGLTVNIPGPAADGETDSATVTVSAVGDPSMTKTATATTYAGNQWVTAPGGGLPALWPAYASDGASLFYLDGLNEAGAPFSRVQVFNPGTGWAPLPGKGTPYYGGVAGYNSGDGLIYYAPGFGAGMVGSSGFFTLDPATGVWASKPNRPQGMGLGGGGVTSDGKFVWVGGSPNAGFITNTPVYVFNGTTWETRTPLSGVALIAPGYVMVGNVLYVGGSYMGSHLFYKYDVSADVWTPLANLPAEAGVVSPLFIDDGAGKIYAIGGGLSAGMATTATWRYDIATDTWEPFTDLDVAVLGNGGGLLDGYYYTFGGGSNSAAANEDAPHYRTIAPCPDLPTQRIYGTVMNGVTNLPIEGVLVESTYTGGVAPLSNLVPVDTTDAEGHYELLVYDPGQYHVTATFAPFDAQAADVVVNGADVLQDFTMGPPAIEAAPQAFEKTLLWGEIDTDSLGVANLGYSVLDWELTESNGGGPFYGTQAAETPYSAPSDKVVQGLRAMLDRQASSGKADEAQAPEAYDVELVMDDGTQENGLVLRDPNTLIEFRAIVLNRFPAAAIPDENFVLTHMEIHQDTAQLVGKDIQLLVYVDPDGGSATNAILVHDEVVQIQDETGWNYYDLDAPVPLDGTADVLIGFSTVYAAGGVPWPSGVRYPYPMDETAPVGNAWLGWMTTPADPVDVSNLGSLTNFVEMGSLGYPCNWLVRGYGALGGGGIPWLSEDPVAGSLPPQEDTPVELTFDAGAVTEYGTYTGTLILGSNDPANPEIAMPVTLHVLENPGAAAIEGTVTGDRPGGPIEGATVQLTSVKTGWTTSLETDENGYYHAMIRAADMPTLTVDVSAPGYVPDVQDVKLLAATTNLHDVELEYAGPWITLDQTVIEKDVPWGSSLGAPLVVGNVGNQALNYNVNSSFSVLLNEEFEGTFPPAGWTVVNHGGSCVWQNNVYYGDSNNTGGNGNCADADSDYCGTVAMNTSLVSPPIDLTQASGARFTYKFDYYYYSGDYGYVEVSNNGGATWTTLRTFSSSVRGPQQQTFSLNAYAGQVIQIRFRYVANYDWWFEVDDVVVEAQLPGFWLSWTPDSGSVAVDSTATVNFTLDATNTDLIPRPGDYETLLTVESNDPFEPMLPVQVIMHVTENPLAGHVFGTILGNRTPEGPNMPLAGAYVEFWHTDGPGLYSMLTDENGAFDFYMVPANLGEYQFYAEAEGYLPYVTVIPVAAGTDIEANATLRLWAPYLTTDPESISRTVPWQGNATVPMVVTNPTIAAAPLVADIVEMKASFSPVSVQTVEVNLPAFVQKAAPKGAVLDSAAVKGMKATTLSVRPDDLSLGSIEVGIFSYDSVVDPTYVDALVMMMSAYPDLNVTVIPVEGTPLLSDLTPYDLILYGGRYSTSSLDGNAIGDVFADYVDNGGRVILIQNAFYAGVNPDGTMWKLGGRFEAEYAPVTYAGFARYTGTETTGMYNPVHPIMDGWDPATNYVTDYFRSYSDLAVANGGEPVLFWNTGNLYIAANRYAAVFNQVLTFDYVFEGDVPMLLHNAILFLAVQDVPWLTESVTHFELPVGSSATTNVGLNAAVPEVTQPGTYHAWLWFDNNDPLQQGAYVPVNMTVQADPTMGKVSGRVTLNRHATGLNVPADGASVVLTTGGGTIELLTNENGQYAHYYTQTEIGTGLDVQVTASYAGYQDKSATVHVTSGGTAVANLQLDLLAPWMDYSPPAFSVVLVSGAQETLELVIENAGLTPLVIPQLQEIPSSVNLPKKAQHESVTWVDAPFTVDSQVADALRNKDAKTDVFIWLRERADLAPAYDIQDKNQRGQFVFDTLSRTAQRSQAKIVEYLEGRGLDYQSFWVNNSILVHGADQALVDAMRARGDVVRIRGVYTQMTIPEPEKLDIYALDDTTADPTWNIDMVNAPEVWEQLGITGEGAVVANIDTGVRYTHEALVDHYRGNLGDGNFEHNYNWGSLYGGGPTACTGSTEAPCDWAGHGSHTMGTMVGGDGTGSFDMDIGMAPGAKWMACMGCDTPPNGCSDAALTGCAEWVVAPLDLNGQNPDPTKAPDVVNNSWGGGGGDEWYYSYTEAWRAAGIIPVFSAGNSGPTCNSVGSPGDYDTVFGMGGTDNADNNYTSSARGPGLGSGVFPELKPDVAAPAENVPSSVNTADDAYAYYSGTSMAAPHMSGLVALMRSVDPNVDFDTIYDLVTANTVTSLTIKNGTWCEGVSTFPNFVFGYGRIDAYQTIIHMQAALDIPWLTLDPVSGTVPAGGAMPVAVTFDATGMEPGVYTGTVRILHNDPLLGQVDIPVEMTVVAPNAALSPESDHKLGLPGKTVEYTLVLQNTGTTADTFTFTWTGNVWTVAMPVTSVPLAAGASANVLVRVTIPAGANDGDLDQVTVTATSGVGATASSVLTTEAQVARVYLPLVLSKP